MSEREVLTWEGFGTAGRELAQQVVDDGFQPDLILTIARGGLIPMSPTPAGRSAWSASSAPTTSPRLGLPCSTRSRSRW